jgi:uncharacterized membrane protein YsdA (DUF1294 family)
MIRATLFIIWCSARNRARQRLRRLREPRYLVGALVGGAYLVAVIFGRMRALETSSGRRRRSRGTAALLPGLGASGPTYGGAFLLGLAGLSLAMPVASGLLEFTPAETALLFPAPVTRRQLLVYRLMRAQWAVLLGAAIFALTYPTASLSARLRGLVGGWLLLMTTQVFFSGVTLTRLARVSGREPSVLARAPFALVLLALGIVGAAIVGAAWSRPLDSAGAAFRLLGEVALQGLPHFVLLPFVAVVTPLFADSLGTFIRSLPAALLVYVLVVAWVLHVDEALDRVADESVERQAHARPRRQRAYKARAAGMTLGLVGRPEWAFLWKGALQTFRIVDGRVLLRGVLVVMWLVGTVALFERTRGLAQALAVLAMVGAGFTVLMGPQIFRLDLRQDLQHLEVLKTWPVGASAVVRGEIAWPATMTTAVAWALVVVAMVLSAAVLPARGRELRLVIGLASLVLVPALVLAQYTVHNAVALLFPAWISMGPGRPRGLDAMGQRLIVLSATGLMLLVALVPGLLVGGMLWLAFYRVMGIWVLVPGALASSAIVVVEVLLAIEALGPAYDRLDLTSVEKGE